MKSMHVVASVFCGGPVSLLLAGVCSSVMSAGAALMVGAIVGTCFGLLLIRAVKRPTVPADS